MGPVGGATLAQGDAPSAVQNGDADTVKGIAPTVPRKAPRQAREALMELPEEVLVDVAEHIARASLRDLCSFATTCRRAHAVADAVLYRHTAFASPEHHLVFSESLTRRPRRASAIHELTLAYPSSPLAHLEPHLEPNGPEHDPVHGSQSQHSAPGRIEALSRALSAMSNVTSLNVAVPIALAHGIGALFNGPFDLACLRHCSLFYQCDDDGPDVPDGHGLWDLHDNMHVFAHPALETLTVRRARLDDVRGFAAMMERPHMTPLRVLRLLECDVSDEGLADVLEIPSALHEFVLTFPPELAAADAETETETTDSMTYYQAALEAQAASLEAVTLDLPAWVAGRHALRLRGFERLHTLRLGWDFQLFGRSSSRPRLHSVGMPPVLRTLEFLHELGEDDEVTELLVQTVQNHAILAASWERMIVPAGDDGRVPREVWLACRESGLRMDVIGAEDDDEEDIYDKDDEK